MPCHAVVRPVIFNDRTPPWNTVVSAESVPAPNPAQPVVPFSRSALVRKFPDGGGVLVLVGVTGGVLVGPPGVTVTLGVLVRVAVAGGVLVLVGVTGGVLVGSPGVTVTLSVLVEPPTVPVPTNVVTLLAARLTPARGTLANCARLRVLSVT